jgi:hypothetical protein
MGKSKQISPPKRPSSGKKKGISAFYIGIAALILSIILGAYVPEYLETRAKAAAKAAKLSKGDKKKSVLSLDLNKTIERAAKAIKERDFERAAKLSSRAVEEFPTSW